MLKLKNVSKFYYSKGVIAAGFSKVNIEFNLGEFVAIVGESGSGKSTLLNVISGLDSYEEGEMYINGEETSHYREIDFEEYRKKYVSNIFQNFNLVNSYTVYQNIEMVLLINGYKKREVKEKVLDLIDKVKLTKYKNTKVSKLSGGQKQRVAIARALAKETPIIVADEPTGNLDSKSARDVIKLLKDISKDKLVIVVTHNFSEVEDVATRVVKMHDGKILSDKKNNDAFEIKNVEVANGKKMGLYNMIRLGVRNTFNIIPKFLLIFIVFLFVITSLLSVYASLKKNEYEEGKMGVNYFFSNIDDKRIIINKKNRETITSDEFKKLEEVSNVDYVIKNDIMLDEHLWFESIDDNPFSFNGTLNDVEFFSGKLDHGRMPKENNEVLLLVSDYDYYFNDKYEMAMEKEYYYQADKNSTKLKVVGIKYNTDANIFNFGGSTIYANETFINNFMGSINRNHSTVTVNINGKNYDSYNDDNFDIRIGYGVTKGNAYVSENISYACKDYDCNNKNLTINVKNLYFTDSITLGINNVYNNKNVNKLLGITKDSFGYGAIYINPDDYNRLFRKESYQASVMVDKPDNVDKVSNDLEELGFKALQVRKTLTNDASDALKVLKIVKLVVIIVVVITLFFISYFVIKLILKSRNVYFSTLRILGANYRNIKKILDVELFTNSTLAYLVFMAVILLVKNKIINVGYVNNIVHYLKVNDYVLMYIILMVMTYLISSRFASKMFKKSAMKTYREEV